MKRFLISLLLILSVFLSFSACGDSSDDNTTVPSTTEYQIPVSTTEFTPDTSAAQTTVTEVQAITETLLETLPQTEFAEKPTPQEPVTSTESTAPSTTKVYEKTGDMAFSDSADNKYIKAVTDKYKINPKNVVVLYTVPDNDGNLVLEFDGSTDSNGKKIRNKDTLVAIYSIDRNLVSKCASEDKSKNEYSYGEMKVIYFSTTTYIMPEFADKL